MSKEKIVEKVVREEPVVLYQVLSHLGFGSCGEAEAKMAKEAFAQIIHDVYIDGEDKGVAKREVPEGIDHILEDLISHLEGTQTELEEKMELEEHYTHITYIKEHNLEWVLEVIRTHSGTLNTGDHRLDCEWVYHYHSNGNTIAKPTSYDEERSIVNLYISWLESVYQI